MSFWDSKILLTIVSAVVGVLGKVVYDIRTKNQLCEPLERGIKAEVKVLKDWIKSLHDYNHLYLDILNAGKPLPEKYKSLSKFKMSFTEANLKKIGVLDIAFLEPLMEVRVTLERLPEELQTIGDIQEEVIGGNQKKRNSMVIGIEGVIATYNYIDKLCGKLLEFEGNYSTTDTVIRYLKNTIVKIKRLFR